MIIRAEKDGDRPAIRHVNERAFERAGEADLVDALRREADPFVSLVADDGGRVVGHICFSPVEVVVGDALQGEGRSVDAGARSAAAGTVLGLAPMAVTPERQRQGIGSMLVEKGLATCRERGIVAVVVLGHPDYYPKFGFVPAARYRLHSEYDVPSEAFMAIELTPRGLAGNGGIVRYHPAFGQIG